MSDEVRYKIDSLESITREKISNTIIVYKKVTYNVTVRLYGYLITDYGKLKYFGKVIITNGNKYIDKGTRIKVARKYANKVSRKNSDEFKVYADSEYNIEISFKERLI